MSTRSPSALWRSSAALVGAVVAVGVLLTAPSAPEPAPERVLLSPTADPSTSQTVTWRADTTDEPALQIAPAHDPDHLTTVQAQRTGQAGGTYYAATATDLEPGTTHRYRVGDLRGRFSDWVEFTTAADTAEPFSFLYFGDLQNDITEGAAPVVRAALEAEPEAKLAIHAGDLVDEANDDEEWDQWFEAFGPHTTADINHLATPGNHEYTTALSLSDHWQPQFPGAGNGPDDGGDDLAQTIHYTDYQGVRLVVLNSNYREAAPVSSTTWLEQQRDWLTQVLTDNPQEWTVVTFHHPLFSSNPGRDNAPLRRAWLHTLEEFDVDLVLTGHDHSYSRGNLVEHRTTDPRVHTGPVYAVAVTGPKMYAAEEDNWIDNDAEARVQQPNTQTFQTVTVDGHTLQYLARTADGRTVDSFTIVKGQDGKHVTDTH